MQRQLANIEEEAKKQVVGEEKDQRFLAIKSAVEHNQLSVREANNMIMAKAKQTNKEMLNSIKQEEKRFKLLIKKLKMGRPTRSTGRKIEVGRTPPPNNVDIKVDTQAVVEASQEPEIIIKDSQVVDREVSASTEFKADVKPVT